MARAATNATAAATVTDVPPCAHCAGALKAARLPTDEQFAAAFDKETGVGLPSGWDTMQPKQRAKFGNLYTCRDCGAPFRLGGTNAPADETEDA